jgi:class 3 adenylate cyclase
MGLVYKGIEIPDNDAERVAAVRCYDILETDAEDPYDDITELAAVLTGCPVAYISIFDDSRSWLKSSYGLPPNRPPRPRELSLCSPTICQSDLLIVPDLSQNPRYADLPAVTDPPHAKFYCAMPLINKDGYALGTLCVWDTQLRELSPDQQQGMRRLARLVLELLESRRRMLTLAEENQHRHEDCVRATTLAQKTEALVRDLLPDPIADTLIANEPIVPRFYDGVTITFIDFVGFSTLTEMLEPRELIEQLDTYFCSFDRIVDQFGLQKIKTVGDAYLAGAGVLHGTKDHAVRVCAAAHMIHGEMDKINAQRRALGLGEWQIRTGIHSGNVIAGTVGKTRITYDVWGDGVNLAKRMQEASEPGRINISGSTYSLISKFFEAEARGAIEVKNKGPQAMYYLLDPK